jgi:hypothetical protein
MKDFLKLWANGLITVRPLPIAGRVTVTGERDAHLGPRWEFARIRVTVEPSAGFEVVDAVKGSAEMRKFGFPDSAIFGLLDVLMVAGAAPLSSVRVILEQAEVDPVNTSASAFREAGRNAGRKIAAHFVGVERQSPSAEV